MWKRRLPEDLTAREREVFELLRRGLTNEEIARRLSISVAGVKYHVSQILSKLGASTREEAAGWGSEERGWYWKLAWLTGASLAVAASAGLGVLLLDRDGGLDLESEVIADHDAAGAARSTPVGPASPDAGAGHPLPSVASTPIRSPVSTSANVAPIDGAASRPLAAPTETRSAPATESATPTPMGDGGSVSGGTGRIAFDTADHIDVMAHDGSGRTSITNSATELDAQPAWSPDGTKIAFSRGTLRYANSSDIYVASADGSGLKKLTNLSGNDVHPTWSPDGSRISFQNDFSLWVMNADGSNATMVFGSPDVGVRAPSWSPVGPMIVFHGYFYDQTIGRTTSDIFAVSDDGSGLTRLTNDPADDIYPAWSPDGTRIAFTRAPAGMSYVDWEIYVMNADGSNQVRLTNNGTEPAWSPDGRTIAFTRRAGTNLDIYSIGVDGTNEVNLTNSPADESSPDWAPGPPPPTALAPLSSRLTERLASTDPIAASYHQQAWDLRTHALRPVALLRTSSG